MMDVVSTLIRSRSFCVLATAGEEAPRCSLMSYAPSPSDSHLFMVTLENSEKWRNILRHPQVSLLIDDRVSVSSGQEPVRALTLWGDAACVDTGEETHAAVRCLLAAHPGLSAFLDQESSKIFRVTPRTYLLLVGPRDAHYGSFESEGEDPHDR